MIDSMRAILSLHSSRQMRQGTCVHVSQYALDGLAQFGITDVICDVEMADVFPGAFWDVSLLVAGNEPGVMLFRYTAHGDFGGDTYHSTPQEAIEQASFEYGEALGEWMAVPDDVVDAHAFAVAYAHDRLNGRGGW